MGTTKQAASKLIETMDVAGYVRRTANNDDARQRPVELTPRGRHLLATVEQIYTELEAEWALVIGQSNIERLRHDLVTVLSQLNGGELPPVRPTW